MNREVKRRLLRIESEIRLRQSRVRYVVSAAPYHADGSPPTEAEMDAADREPSMMPEEWEAQFCTAH